MKSISRLHGSQYTSNQPTLHRADAITSVIYIPRPRSAPVNRCATLSGSCLAISMTLSSFLIPICNLEEYSSAPPKAESCISWIACLRSSPDANSSTSRKTYSRAVRLVIGGTRSSESNVSDRPRSVRMGRSDEVAIIRRRRP